MATILQKTPSDNALVLDTREALIYPFGLDGWTNIRIGMFVSITSATNINSGISTADTLNTSYPNDTLWIGLKNSNNDDPPSSTGSFYAGFYFTNGGSMSVQTNNMINHSSIGGALISGESIRSSTSIWFPFGNTLPIQTDSNISGSSQYFSFIGFVAERNAQNVYTGRYIGAATSLSNPSITALRELIRNQPINGTVLTGFLPSGEMNFYLYHPFFNSKMRIHNLLVEEF